MKIRELTISNRCVVRSDDRYWDKNVVEEEGRGRILNTNCLFL
jgi:hypothetical protein